MSEQNRIALLIDCDNVSHHAIEGVLAELARYGTVNVRHAHGDWNNPCLSGWAEQLHYHAIRPMQQFAYTKGKNATDSSMIIDAMDILYSKNIDAFALMTSDSDFTPLVLRILESGLTVYGFGAEKTPRAFVASCSRFIFTEQLSAANNNDGKLECQPKQTKQQLRKNDGLAGLLKKAVVQTAGDDDWSNLSRVGSYISNHSSFSSINYGYKRLGDLIKAMGLFEIQMRDGGSSMYIKPGKG